MASCSPRAGYLQGAFSWLLHRRKENVKIWGNLRKKRSAGVWTDYRVHRVVGTGFTRLMSEQTLGGCVGESFRCHCHPHVDIIQPLVMRGKAFCKQCRLGQQQANKQPGRLSLYLRLTCPLEGRCWPLSQTVLDSSVGKKQAGGPLSHWESRVFCLQDMPLPGVQSSLKTQDK